MGVGDWIVVSWPMAGLRTPSLHTLLYIQTPRIFDPVDEILM